jgi:CheY-like chemotaxis protein
MDLQMPKMDGMEATRRIIADFPGHRCPTIIAMTANALEGDRQECLDAGMHDYVTKPVKIEQLAHALSQCQPLLLV